MSFQKEFIYNHTLGATEARKLLQQEITVLEAKYKDKATITQKWTENPGTITVVGKAETTFTIEISDTTVKVNIVSSSVMYGALIVLGFCMKFNELFPDNEET